MESGSRISYTRTLEEQTLVYLSVSPTNLSIMLVWNNLADPHLSVFFYFARFSQTLTLKLCCPNIFFVYFLFPTLMRLNYLLVLVSSF